MKFSTWYERLKYLSTYPKGNHILQQLGLYTKEYQWDEGFLIHGVSGAPIMYCPAARLFSGWLCSLKFKFCINILTAVELKIFSIHSLLENHFTPPSWNTFTHCFCKVINQYNFFNSVGKTFTFPTASFTFF